MSGFVVHQRVNAATKCGAISKSGQGIVQRGAQQLSIFGLQAQLPLFHLIQQTIKVLGKQMKLFNAFFRHAA
ncbi:hypothetical protein D3C73_1487310 [compost metagenome]